MTADEIERRVADLDERASTDADPGEPFDPGGARSLFSLTQAFVHAMSDVSFRGVPDGEVTIVHPEEAAAAVAGSVLVTALRHRADWLWSGPTCHHSEQRWVATRRPSWVDQGSLVPTRSLFVPAATLTKDTTKRRPLLAGINTCSATGELPGMWRLFLDLNGDARLWRRPWRTWRVTPVGSARIAQVGSAVDWADLVVRHHVRGERRIHPNWPSIADEYDAVHVSPAAVCGVDGVALVTSAGTIAPVYWTVEQTLWLRWCFETEEVPDPTTPT